MSNCRKYCIINTISVVLRQVSQMPKVHGRLAILKNEGDWVRLMKREGGKLLRKMGFQTPYFDSGGGWERWLAIRGLRALEPPASKMGSVTMTGPLSRALRQLRIWVPLGSVKSSNNDRPAFQGIETKKHRQRRLCLHRNNDPPNLPAHFITQREIAEAAPVEYLQKHGF
jgi:hypothetical protein